MPNTPTLTGRQPGQQGFTLVEMAIVLVIIGLILGAVSIAKDLQRDAEYTKINQKFATGWKQAYDAYYQRTGVVVGDNQTAPTYMVNGQVVDNIAVAQSGLAGVPANYSGTGLKICHLQGYAQDEVGDGDADLETDLRQDLHALMDRAGVRMPGGRAEGQEDRYLYIDSNGNPAELQICFQWNTDGTISGAGNVMVLRGLTPDLARYLDQSVDGKPDALEGRFRQQYAAQNDQEPSSQEPGREWSSNNTFKMVNSISPTSDGELTNPNLKDEDRIILLTAHWVMDI